MADEKDNKKPAPPAEPEQDTRLVWEGKAGIRKLSVSDFRALGIRADGDYAFYRNQPTLVPAPMAKGLAESVLVPGFRILD